MVQKIPYRNIPQLLLRAREELLCHFRPIINHFGLTEPQWRIIRALSEHEQLEPRELCELCQILSPSLTGVLSRMEDLGLVARSRVPEDQRRVMVRLTPKSQQIFDQMAPLIAEQYHNIEQAFGTELIHELYDILDRVIYAKRPPTTRIELPPVDDTAP
ncbi:MAG: homoprotocatechuate degradation operon regulator HpaR [Zoogloea sp.]|nr:homoprotocatechuate degradation operon regulator HpaR [Zoogloea sp.]